MDWYNRLFGRSEVNNLAIQLLSQSQWHERPPVQVSMRPHLCLPVIGIPLGIEPPGQSDMLARVASAGHFVLGGEESGLSGAIILHSFVEEFNIFKLSDVGPFSALASPITVLKAFLLPFPHIPSIAPL